MTPQKGMLNERRETPHFHPRAHLHAMRRNILKLDREQDTCVGEIQRELGAAAANAHALERLDHRLDDVGRWPILGVDLGKPIVHRDLLDGPRWREQCKLRLRPYMKATWK